VNTPSRIRTLLAASVVGCLYAILLLGTSYPLPMGWDEGETIARAEMIGREPDLSRSARARGLIPDGPRSTASWPFTLVRDGSPPLGGILVNLGTRVAPEALDPLTRGRLGPILLFSLAAGAMFYRLQRDYHSWAVSLMAIAALATMPRLFAHAHFAALDGPLTACWVLAWVTFGPACRDWRFAPVFGLMLGLTFLARFSGWLAVCPFAVWAFLYRDWAGWRALLIAVPIAIGVFILINPPLWEQPLQGLLKFFELNLLRSGRPRLNFSTQFLGERYGLDRPLPWYNGLVWTAITISPMTLVFGCAGIVTTLRRWQQDRVSTLLVCQWATLVIARAVPILPPQDGERMMLPSFAFFAALVGVGLGRALYRDTLLKPQRIVAQGWAKVAMVIVLAAATFDAVTYFPHNLSYYNRLIGGLRGAVALGMEPTYYWDALDRDTLAWLKENTPETQRVMFGSMPQRNLELLTRWGLIDFQPEDGRPVHWHVIQYRPSAWRASDRWLVENEKPAYRRSFLGVPLVDVYSSDAAIRARTAAPR
jgi:hypothetical protein